MGICWTNSNVPRQFEMLGSMSNLSALLTCMLYLTCTSFRSGYNLQFHGLVDSVVASQLASILIKRTAACESQKGFLISHFEFLSSFLSPKKSSETQTLQNTKKFWSLHCASQFTCSQPSARGVRSECNIFNKF